MNLKPYGNEGELRERYAKCRRAAARNGTIGFIIALLAILVGGGYFTISTLLGHASQPTAFIIVALLLPAWPFFRKKSALETESYAIDRELQDIEKAKREAGPKQIGDQL